MNARTNLTLVLVSLALAVSAVRTDVCAQEAPLGAPKQQNQLKEQLANLDFALQQFAVVKERNEARIREVKAHLAQLQDKRAALLSQQNELGVSSASYDDIMRLLQTQKVQLTIELAGIEARREAMMQQQEEERQSKAESKGSALAALKELADIQTERLEQTEELHKAGSAPRAEVLDAKQKLLEVKIRLEELMQSASQLGPAESDRELLSVSLTRAETTARLDKVNQLLAEYVRALAPIDSLGKVKSEMQAVESALADLTSEIRRHEDQLSAVQQQRDQLIEQLRQFNDASDDRDN